MVQWLKIGCLPATRQAIETLRILIIAKTDLEKNPFNCKVYEAEERMHYCRCPMLRKHLYEIPSTFCYCGAGCYRQQWEGIFGTPVQIEILKSLTKGDDVCQFAIHLPS